jgi:hypothetical protein
LSGSRAPSPRSWVDQDGGSFDTGGEALRLSGFLQVVDEDAFVEGQQKSALQGHESSLKTGTASKEPVGRRDRSDEGRLLLPRLLPAPYD